MSTWNSLYTAIKAQVLNYAGTSTWKVYAGEEPSKKTYPCILVFPRRKITDKEIPQGRRRKSPKKVWYVFDFTIVTDHRNRDSLLFGSDSITEYQDTAESMLSSDLTIGGVGIDADWANWEFEFRPGEVAITITQLFVRVTESE